MRVLRKLYKYENSQYDPERKVSLYQLDILSDKEQTLLSYATHKRYLDAFIAGVGGSYLRGRSVLGAFHKLQNLPLHDYEEKPQYACCWICSDGDQQKHINDSYFQYCLYYGNSYTGNPSYAYL